MLVKICNKRYITYFREGFKPKWNELDNGLDRRSYKKGNEIEYAVVDGFPLNPKGRTGLRGRGSLHYWGPNHTVEIILTRWRKGGKRRRHAINPVTNLPILECMVCCTPASGDQWYLPSVQWNFAPKHTFAGKNILEIVTYRLPASLLKVFFESTPKKTAEANCKEARTLRRALKAAEKDNFEKTEGLLYAPGIAD
ncbi:nudt9 [Trichonephila clavipes]|nr:nudt9 [Trichonephila clavipes]